MTDTAGTPAEPDQPADDVSEASHGGDAGQAAEGTDAEPDDAVADPGRPPPAGAPPEAKPRPAAPPEAKPHPDAPPETAPPQNAPPETAPPETAPPETAPPEDRPPKPPRHWLRWTALGLAVAVLAAAGVGWSLYKKLEGNITEDTSAAAELERYERERPAPTVHDALNILLIGSDTRAGKGNRPYGRDPGTQRSDTTILLHLAADRQSATAVSVPRDLMVEIPGCRRQDGSRTKPQLAQFNWAFQFGGAACTIRTVEKLTEIRIDHHMIVDFQGFKKMVDAVDGVEVCLKEPINDKGAKLKLKAGRQKLNGEQALGYVRARKSLGDGSDTERMDRQQQFLGALVNKVKSNGVLLNPTRLYPVLDAATSALTTDPALAGLTDLYELVRSMRNIPTEKVQFLTVPRRSYTDDPNRDELVQPDAGRLFDRLRNDVPVEVTPRDADAEGREKGSDDDGSDEPTHTPSPAPTFRGNTAAGTSCE
ncbi:LCP family protein [Streptomyces sp. B-S-A8]|uniref:LCP family protein n=1 Tax=Streptomyces solicavernae TaxID=3043614 RepID=A0ABT6S2J2_9ACTN|nr:LCP family protein [Streptomyces sp. B-S-A8]MDI3390233.1 LCP family protein [Streptomyces sp. B-S-A8]